MLRARDRKFSHRKSATREPLFLANAILHDLEDGRVGPHGRVARGGAKALLRNFFDLERDDVAAARELGGRSGVLERRRDQFVDDETRRTRRIGIERAYVIAERARGHRHHASELAAAENAERRAR